MRKAIWVLVTIGFFMGLLLVDWDVNAAKAFLSGITGGMLLACLILRI